LTTKEQIADNNYLRQRRELQPVLSIKVCGLPPRGPRVIAIAAVACRCLRGLLVINWAFSLAFVLLLLQIVRGFCGMPGPKSDAV
jgi:hypothetical protein